MHTPLKEFPAGFRLTKRGGRNRDPEDNEIDVKISKFSRTILKLTVEHATATTTPAIKVFATHLKAKLPTGLDKEEKPKLTPHKDAVGGAISTIRRTAEAAALRVYLNKLTRGTETPVVVMGDFNDSLLSNTLAILTGQPSYLLSRRLGGSDLALYSTGMLNQLRSFRDTSYTHEFKNVQETLDHVLVSEQFYDNSRKSYWTFDGLRVWNDHLEEHSSKTSDHGIVRASFRK